MADLYTEKVFPVISYPYCYITGLLPFSLGEFMLYLAAFILSGLLIISIVLVLRFLVGLIIFLVKPRLSGTTNENIKQKHFFPKWYLGMLKITGCIAIVVTIIMILNCFIQYQTSEFKDMTQLSSNIRKVSLVNTEDNPPDDATMLVLVRDYIVGELNELSTKFIRDENGYIIDYPGNDTGNIIGNRLYANPSLGYRDVLATESKKAMNNLAENGLFRLKGYYPRPKYLWKSDFFSQQHMMGYYFPFSMEANVNGIMYIANYPFTICHELSHLKGYIREDEANFIAYLACINSDDLFFQYCGYLGVLNYIDNDFYYSVNKDNDIYFSHININRWVRNDSRFLTKEAWDIVEKNKIVETETVHKASNKFTETVLTTNGVKDGMKSYNRVVKLLIDYYR